MASVTLVSKAGLEFSVTSVRAFVNAVYGRGAIPKSGTIPANYAYLQDAAGPAPVDGANDHVTLHDLETENTRARAAVMAAAEAVLALAGGVGGGGGGGGGGGSSSASDLTSGTLAPARIADNSLPTSKLTGQLADGQIPAGITRDSELAAALAALVASAPGTLDTLDELAAALADDPNFATTLTNLVGTKVSKTGNETVAGVKTFSSSPVVPTPTADGQAAPKSYIDGLLSTLAGNSLRVYAAGAWPVRGVSALPLFWISTSDSSAPRPPGMIAGDMWIADRP